MGKHPRRRIQHPAWQHFTAQYEPNNGARRQRVWCFHIYIHITIVILFICMFPLGFFFFGIYCRPGGQGLAERTGADTRLGLAMR